MSERERVTGVVINVHALGATIRLENGALVAASLADVDRNRPAYQRAFERRTETAFEREGRSVILATVTADERVADAASAESHLMDDAFEARMNDYLKQTEAWAPPDRPAPFERHLFKKRQRARHFEAEPPG